MNQKRTFVKELTLKHKRENKFIESLKTFFSNVLTKVQQPIKLGTTSLKKFNINYEGQDESLVPEFSEVPEKKEHNIAKSEEHNPSEMVDKLRDAYKL